MASPLPPEDFGPDLEALANIGGLLTPREDYVPNLQSVYGDIIQNAADYQYFTAPLSNQGRTTATYGGQNNIVVAPDTAVRVVNNATGEVVYSGVGYEGAQSAIDAANALSASTGKKANWDIQVAGPTMQGFQSVSTDRPDTSALDVAAKVAGTALPIAVNFIPGLQGVGAVLANAAAGAGGAALTGADPLKGALMGGLTSAGTQFLGPVVQSANGAATNLGRAVGAAAGATAGGVATGKSLENSLLGGAIAGGTTYLGGELFGPKNLASDDLVTQNINRALANLENGLIDVGAFGPDFLDAIYKSEGLLPKTSTVSSGDTVVTGTVPRTTTTGSSTPGLLPGIDVTALRDMATQEGETPYTMPSDYVVTGDRLKTDTTKNEGTPITVTGTPVGSQKVTDTTKNEGGTIVVTGTQNTPKFDSDGTYKGDLTYIPSLVDDIVQQEQSGDTKDKKDSDLKKVLEYASLASLAAELFGGGGGGGGGGSTTPYVSPFGPGTGFNFGAGTTMGYQANPNILDYERYGFGPEASFFRPEYNQLIGGGAMSPTTTRSPSDVAQIYKPLI